MHWPEVALITSNTINTSKYMKKKILIVHSKY